jgi:hypothetical protein
MKYNWICDVRDRNNKKLDRKFVDEEIENEICVSRKTFS